MEGPAARLRYLSRRCPSPLEQGAVLEAAERVALMLESYLAQRVPLVEQTQALAVSARLVMPAPAAGDGQGTPPMEAVPRGALAV